jgi:hypothetical protein
MLWFEKFLYPEQLKLSLSQPNYSRFIWFHVISVAFREDQAKLEPS